ncbi:MAG: hypothetical protein OXJ52_00775 [Oligoflexia bacterium]|nr:hypothetical protein [Oligoflexia bacterium]
MNLHFVILFFAMTLLGCPTQPQPGLPAGRPHQPSFNPSVSSPQNGSSMWSPISEQKMIAPIWAQTDRIFYNKTGQPITVVLVKEGKIRTKAGRVLERSDGGTMGQDGIFREYIIKGDGSQEYVTREYKETPLTLKAGECVLTSAAFFKLKMQGKTVCDTLRHGEPEPKRVCFRELRKLQNQNGWHANKRDQGSFPYVEFYDINNGEPLFEGAGEPRPLDNSFRHSCKILSLVD